MIFSPAALSQTLVKRGRIARNALAIVVLALALLAFSSPILNADPRGRVGFLLLIAAAIEIVHGFRRATLKGQREAWFDGLVSLVMALLLINAPMLASSALVIFLAATFAFAGLGNLLQILGLRTSPDSTDGAANRSRAWLLMRGAFNLVIAAVLILFGRYALEWSVAIAAGLRMLRTSVSIATSPVFGAGDVEQTIIADLGLPDDPALAEEARQIAQSERDRTWVDRGWIIGFIATLFAIHITRMGFDRSYLGIFSPAFAVVGDLFIALVLAFLVIMPTGIGWRWATAPLERRFWPWVLDPRGGTFRAAARWWMRHRLRRKIRLRLARYSVRTALGRGLQTGLPIAAIIAATVPVWGMSWYFDTENWASGVWNSWAEQRTDTWRQAMAKAVMAIPAPPSNTSRVASTNSSSSQPSTQPSTRFAVHPPGTDGDFTFIVIGDTGEGDASQHSLRAAYLNVVERDDVKFVVLSSDVVYPTGAMRHYEANFWIPFMGTTKPLYAIPGNHDWYDALEGFVATFFKPDSARAAMIARIEIDMRLTSTNEKHVDHLIATATRLRGEYGVPTQQQDAPYFQFQTKDFALFAVDTGVAKSIDSVQMQWLREALESARGKMKMAILGHPFYAAGVLQVSEGKPFAEIRELLREHEVAIVMAGDTHDLEYYREPYGDGATHHFVNGGGGAYLSYGTSLAFPEKPATADWAIYPSREAVVAKISATTPWWKRPFWWWTDKAGAWPFSAEFLSAAFDSNVAPFYQSFVEVRIEQSARRIRIIPHGVRGRLRWNDLQSSPSLPAGSTPREALVEWIIDLPR